MDGIVRNFRRAKYRTSNTHMLIEVEGVTSKEKAAKLVGKKVVWTSPAKSEISGKVASPHGAKGIVRVIFEKGLPGQALQTKVKII